MTTARPTKAGDLFTDRDGREWPTTHFHYFQGEIAICPVCNMRPCDDDCPEQFCVNPRRRREQAAL